jgi:hypothetical protein
MKGRFPRIALANHLFYDEPLYVLPLDITQRLITKDWKQVTSYEVPVVALSGKLQRGQNGGLPLRADEIAEVHRRLRFLLRVISIVKAGFEERAGLPLRGKVCQRAYDL